MRVQPALKDLSLFRQAIPELGCSYYCKCFLMPKYFLFHFMLTAFPCLSQGGITVTTFSFFPCNIFIQDTFFPVNENMKYRLIRSSADIRSYL